MGSKRALTKGNLYILFVALLDVTNHEGFIGRLLDEVHLRMRM